MQEQPAISSTGALAYHDVGITCFLGQGIFKIDPSKEGLYVRLPGDTVGTRLGPLGTMPAWSPDGSRLAFVYDNYSIYVYDRQGGDYHLITPDRQAWSPTWSPDGKQIAFSMFDTDDRFYIWIANSDGSGLRKLTPATTISFAEPCWSRQSDRLYAVAYFETDSLSSTMAEIDTSGMVVKYFSLGCQQAGDISVSWNGKWIAYQHSKDPRLSGLNVWVTSADGHSNQPLGTRHGEWSAWTPSDTAVAFTPSNTTSTSRDGGNIWLIRFPGGQMLRQLTRSNPPICP